MKHDVKFHHMTGTINKSPYHNTQKRICGSLYMCVAALLLLEGTARYAGFLLASAEGFVLWLRLFTMIVLILGHFWCSVVTSVKLSCNLNTFENNLKISTKKSK